MALHPAGWSRRQWSAVGPEESPIEAQEARVTANENYIASLFSYNVAKIALARALGSAETRLTSFFGQQ